jgi:anti-anti-sigma factor
VGSLDGETVPDLLGTVEPLLGGAEGLVLDCGSLEFCDSSGLRGFVLLRNQLPVADSFRLADPSPGLRQILAITGLDALVGEPT